MNGPALGSGANLVGWADLAVAEERATFGYLELKAGIASATVIPALLRSIGRKAMNELIYTGRAISAAEAMRLGLTAVLCPGRLSRCCWTTPVRPTGSL